MDGPRPDGRLPTKNLLLTFQDLLVDALDEGRALASRRNPGLRRRRPLRIFPGNGEHLLLSVPLGALEKLSDDMNDLLFVPTAQLTGVEDLVAHSRGTTATLETNPLVVGGEPREVAGNGLG